MSKNKYLFLFSISPVQSFISQARKTQDLYAASCMLSDLIQNVKKHIKEIDNELIFPADNSCNMANAASNPNRFIALIQTDNPETLGKELECCIKKEFENQADEIFKKKYNEISKPENFDKQIENFLEIYWVAIPYDEGNDNYQEKYIEIERLLGAVKNVRKFDQLEERGRKCSLCGERNVLFYKKTDKGNKPRYIQKDAIEINEYQLSPGEGLCAVCFTKRFYEKAKFPSTAKIVLLDWLENVDYGDLKKIENFDEQWFLERNEEVIKNFIQYKKLDPKTQKKYYTLIRFDIDDMGKWLSGEKITSNNLKKSQKELSAQLMEFAKEAESIVNEKGQTVYAGGDDFLGFVNLSHLFKTITCFKRKFSEIVEKKFNGITYSISIIIAHYKTPLHKVLDFSRWLLDETKSFFDDKNGIGIIVFNSSAINSQCFCEYDDFILLRELFENKIGNNLHFKIGMEFDFLKDICSYDDFLKNKKMLMIEIKRLLKREQGDFNQNLYNKLINFLKQQNIEKSTNNYQFNFENFIGFLKTSEQLKKVM